MCRLALKYEVTTLEYYYGFKYLAQLFIMVCCKSYEFMTIFTEILKFLIYVIKKDSLSWLLPTIPVDGLKFTPLCL